MSDAVDIGNYIRFSGGGYAFQPYWDNETRTVAAVNYLWLPFRVTEGSGARGGDRTQGELATPLDQLALNVLSEAKANRYIITVDTYLLDVEARQEVSLISRQFWRINELERTDSELRAMLMSPGDAVRETWPGRRLTTAMVGAVPDTGAI